MQAVDLFVKKIQKKIWSGEYLPDTKLPTERSLSDIYGYSRQTVHNGLIKLSEMGLIKIVPRHGVWVLDYKTQSNFKVLDALVELDKEDLSPELKGDLMDFFSYQMTFILKVLMKQTYPEKLSALETALEKECNPQLCQSIFFDYFHTMSIASENQLIVMLINSFQVGIKNAGAYILSHDQKLYTVQLLHDLNSNLKEKNHKVHDVMHDLIDHIQNNWR